MNRALLNARFKQMQKTHLHGTYKQSIQEFLNINSENSTTAKWRTQALYYEVSSKYSRFLSVISGFTYPNIGKLDKWSHKAAIKLQLRISYWEMRRQLLLKNIFDPAPVQTQKSEGSPRCGDTILQTKQEHM